MNTKRRNTFGYTQIVQIQGALTALNNSGLKATKPRQLILNILAKNRFPMTVEMISQRLKEKIDIVTIYRTLETFEKTSIVKKVNLSGDSKYYEISDAHHHHIICKECGVIEELEECYIEKISPFSEKFSVIFDHSLEFFGRCKNC